MSNMIAVAKGRGGPARSERWVVVPLLVSLGASSAAVVTAPAGALLLRGLRNSGTPQRVKQGHPATCHGVMMVRSEDSTHPTGLPLRVSGVRHLGGESCRDS